MSMDGKGYDFVTQDRLRKTCGEGIDPIFNESYGCELNNDELMSAINYCSLGDFDLSFSCVQTSKNLMRLCIGTDDPNITLVVTNFVLVFWRTAFIQTRFNLECEGSYSMDFLGLLSGTFKAVFDYEVNHDRSAIYGYLDGLTTRYLIESRRVLNEYQATKSK